MGIFVLKMIALCSMLLDHVGLVFAVPGLRIIGRMAFPIFAFSIANGWNHTHDKRAYLGRMCVWAFVSQVPYSLMLGAGSDTGASGVIVAAWPFWLMAAMIAVILFVVIFNKKFTIWFFAVAAALALPGVTVSVQAGGMAVQFLGVQLNVFYTFAVSIGVLYAIETWQAERPVAEKFFVVVAAAVGVAAYGAMCDYSVFGVMLIVGLGVLYGKKLWCSILWAAFWCIIVYGFGNELQCLGALAGVSLVWLYDEKKGPGPGMLQWLFYAFYPAHMAVLWVIKFALRM